jgi:hypothetical protein
MTRPRLLLAAGWALTALLMLMIAPAAQHGPGAGAPPDTMEDRERGRLKRSQVEAMLKEDREKSIDDASTLVKLSEELKAELEKNDKTVLSVAALRKAEEIEKLAKRIRGRLRRY